VSLAPAGTCAHVEPEPRPAAYARRRPDKTVLHQVVREHAETLFAEARTRSESGHGYPSHVEREFRRYIACGVLSQGFLRVHCGGCGRDELVAFSCKRKAICPSCAGRRMNDIAARLVDELLPIAPYRQWVFSFPWHLRVRLAYDKELLSDVLSVCIRKVFAFQRKAARRLGIPASSAEPLAVCFVQRFGSLLQVNPHGHAALPDGVFVLDSDAGVRFVELPPPSTKDLEAVGLAIVRAIVRLLERNAEQVGDPDPGDVAMMQELSEAAKTGIQLARPDREDDRPPAGNSKLAAQIHTDLGVFSLHAQTSVPAHDRAGLERLLRYCNRPAFAHKRLSRTDSGKVSYRLRKPYYTGQTELVLEPVAFLHRLAALVPPRGQNQVRYYGALAARSRVRDQVVGLGLDLEKVQDAPALPVKPQPNDAPNRRTKGYRLAWAKLLARVFQQQVLVCPSCQGPRTIIAAITDLDLAKTILDHLGLPSEQPVFHTARAPPQLELGDASEREHFPA
jgi:ribosomal protein S27E